MKNKVILAILVCVLLLGIFKAASAEFGQTAGVLDFGTLKIGENKTLTYIVVNPGETTIDVKMYFIGDPVLISPVKFTLEPHSQQEIKVTAVANKTGTYTGKVRAHGSEQGNTGTVVFQTELEKDFIYKVSFQLNNYYLLIFGAIAIFIFAGILIVNNKQHKKRRR